MLSLSSEQVDHESKPALIGAPLGIKDALHILHPLVRLVRTRLAIKLGRLVLQEIFQTPFRGWRLGMRTIHLSTSSILPQLAKSIHVLPLSIISSLPSSLHLLHHKVLLFKRGFLALYSRLVLLQHGIVLLGQSCSHCLDCPSKVLPVALRGWRSSYTWGCHIIGHTKRTIRNWVRLGTNLNTTRKAQRKLSTKPIEAKERRL